MRDFLLEGHLGKSQQQVVGTGLCCYFEIGTEEPGGYAESVRLCSRHTAT